MAETMIKALFARNRKSNPAGRYASQLVAAKKSDSFCRDGNPDVVTLVSLPHDLLCRILAAVPKVDGASCLNAIGLAAKACSALGAAAADEETWRRVAVARCIGVTLACERIRGARLCLARERPHASG